MLEGIDVGVELRVEKGKLLAWSQLRERLVRFGLIQSRVAVLLRKQPSDSLDCNLT